jgi:SAM-dependent methyltransferase
MVRKKIVDFLRHFVPVRARRAAARWRTARKRARLFGPLAPMVPPVERMFDGPGGLDEFKANGDEFLRVYRDWCGLQPNERMLDIGSGIGRKTLALTQYLDARATYDGVDVNSVGVEWCREMITPRFPNFRFQQIDVRNELYNPNGRFEASDFRLPFSDASFTFITLGSVFTHMRPAEIEHYLSEIARLLARGRCLISFFLLNNESRNRIHAKTSSQEFLAVDAKWATTTPELPERAIAYDEAYVEAVYRRLNLRIERIEYGSWSGRPHALSYQDLVLATKSQSN